MRSEKKSMRCMVIRFKHKHGNDEKELCRKFFIGVRNAHEQPIHNSLSKMETGK